MRLFTIILLSLLFTFSSKETFAQREYTTKSKKAIKHFEEALKYYSAQRNSDALEYLEKALKADENFVEAYAVSGDCYSDLGDLPNAIVSYQKVVDIAPDFLSTSYKQLADAQFKTGDYESSIPNYEIFLTKKRVNPKLKEDAEKMLKNARFGAVAKRNPVPFDPQNLGPNVNTDEYEYFPVLTADEQTLVFTKNKQRGTSGGFVTGYQEDFYSSKADGEGGWSRALNLGPPLNTDLNEGAQTITADGSQMVYTGCNRRGGKGDCDLYIAKRKGSKWGRPENMDSPINTSKWETQPSISADGKTLYFVSNRPGGFGGADIWISNLAPNGAWTNPRNLGEKINTAGWEETPFIHPDGKTLYFTSNGHVGMGEKDLYVSRMDSSGNWGTPINLGYPINTWNDEIGLFVSASGDMAYFGSQREDGFGKLDIYSFNLYEEVRPARVTYVKGRVTNKVTGVPLGAKFELIDLETAEVVVDSYSDDVNGKFLVTLPVNHDYALNVSKDNFLFYSEHFSLPKEQKITKPFMMDVKLQPIEFGETVVLKNIFFETGSYELLPESRIELDKLVLFMKNNPSIRIEIGGHTDNVGKPEDNQQLSENRSKSVRQYLINNSIVESRIEYRGYGEEQPVATNETVEGRAQNRRTEFKVLGRE